MFANCALISNDNITEPFFLYGDIFQRIGMI